MTPQETLTKHGINLESYAPGRHYTTCPKCSHTRSAPNRKSKVLGITIADDGSVCWGCNHCAWTGPEKGSGKPQERRELTSHLYRDKDGVVRFRKVRNLPGRDPKCWFERPDGRGEWIKGTTGVDTKILYRADEVAKAIADGRVICCVEGEKDSDALWAIGIAATCNAHGASEPGKRAKWTKAHSEQLAGADIVVLNDNDAAGYAHADATCRFSLGIAKRVRRLDLKPHWPDVPKGGDISDWLALGHTRAGLDPLIAAAPDYAPAGEQPKAQESAVDDAAELERLARLSPLDYDRARKDAGKRLGISRLSLLDSLVKAKRAELGFDGDSKQGRAIEFPEPEPWPDPVNGAVLLNALAYAIRRHVVMSLAASHVAALWVIHSWVINCFVISPRLGIRSATKGCGKTLLLDVLGRLVQRPLRTLSITPAATFRVVEAYRPCLLIDEADTFLNDDDGLRGILDGNRQGDTVTRTIGDNHEVRMFATYSAVAIALIGTLPDTLYDRSVVIDLKRRLAKEKIAPFRFDRAGHLDVLARMAARWAADNSAQVAVADPAIPLINRSADNWRPLAMVAAVAGGRWPARVRKAIDAAHAAAIVADERSLLEMLLADIWDIFGDKNEISSADLVADLIEIDGHPWAEWGKNQKPLTQHQLARLLRPLRKLGITTKKIGPKGERVSGYVRADFEEAFARYLRPVGDSDSDTRTQCDEIRTSDDSDSDTSDPRCPSRKCKKPNNDGLVSECPSRKGGNGDARAAAASEPCAGRSPESASDPTELCAQCGRPGGNAVAFGDGSGAIRLHRECEDPWIENRMAQEGIWRA
jgi:hypothetical protein